jgi:hypothetical protein
MRARRRRTSPAATSASSTRRVRPLRGREKEAEGQQSEEVAAEVAHRAEDQEDQLRREAFELAGKLVSTKVVQEQKSPTRRRQKHFGALQVSFQGFPRRGMRWLLSAVRRVLPARSGTARSAAPNPRS